MEDLGPPRVVIVEDSDRERSLLREVLEQEGLEIVGDAGDGDGAVEVADEMKPDVVLMDLRMPGMGGFEATRRIKERQPAIQVIILTAYEDSFLTRSAEQVGAYAYLVKESSPAFTADVIRRAREFGYGVRQQLESETGSQSASGDSS
jgi:DNA-binding NarL/FixJ family response regulator